MLNMTPEAWEQHQLLCAELRWLEREYPDRRALAAVARGHINTIRSCIDKGLIEMAGIEPTTTVFGGR